MQLLADVLLLWMNEKQYCNCHRCRTQICLCRQANMDTKQDREKRKERLRWSIPLLMITWSHTYRTNHLNRWIMGPSPPLQQNHPLHLPLGVSLSHSLHHPLPLPHIIFFMFVCVSNRERHTITRLLSLMVWSEAHSSHRLYTCMCDCEFCWLQGARVLTRDKTPKKAFNSLTSHCPVHKHCKIIVMHQKAQSVEGMSKSS